LSEELLDQARGLTLIASIMPRSYALSDAARELRIRR
jgi:hypothetical protein